MKIPPRRVRLAKIRRPKCKRCSLSSSCLGEVCTMGKGNSHAPIMVIHTKPYLEPSAISRVFNDIVEESGLENQIYSTSIIKCDQLEWFDDNPDLNSQCDACSTYLIKELNIVKPKIIVCLSSEANYYFHKRRVTARNIPYKLDFGPFNGLHYILSWSPIEVIQRGSPTNLELLQSFKIAKEIAIDGKEYETSRGFFEHPIIELPYNEGGRRGKRRYRTFDWSVVFDALYECPRMIYEVAHPEYRQPARVRHAMKSAWNITYKHAYREMSLYTKLGPARVQAWFDLRQTTPVSSP